MRASQLTSALITAALLALMYFPLTRRWQEAKDDVAHDGAAPA